jgi:hypothetical protein
MSPRKAAAAKAAPAKAAMTKPAVTKRAGPKPVALKTVAGKAAKPAEKPAEKAGDASADATRLAAEIERALQAGKLDTLTPEAFQALMAALCKNYGARARRRVPSEADRMSASPTVVMMTSGLFAL